MPFDIVDKIRDSFGAETTLDDLGRPDDVTVERVTDELERALANGDLSVESSGFDDRSALLESVEPLVRDYHDNFEPLDLLAVIEAGWESDDYRTYSEAVDDVVDDDVAELVDRRSETVASILKGFGSTDQVEWIRDYGERYPAVAYLSDFVSTKSKLEDHGYLG